jgi:hypothetical protein
MPSGPSRFTGVKCSGHPQVTHFHSPSGAGCCGEGFFFCVTPFLPDISVLDVVVMFILLSGSRKCSRLFIAGFNFATLQDNCCNDARNSEL